MKKTPEAQNRGKIRFKPEPSTLAYMDFVPESPTFTPAQVGLVCDESGTGCGVIVLDGEDFNVGKKLKIQVGKLSPVPAQIQWITEVDSQVSRIGFLYLFETPKTTPERRAPISISSRPRKPKRNPLR